MEQITTSSDKLTKKNIINRISDIPGGVSLAIATLVAGNVVQEATPLTAPAAGIRSICKQAKLLTGSTTTVMRVESKLNPFKTGDIVFQVVGGAAYAGTVATEVGTVDNIIYDTITVGTALESAAVGTFIYQSSIAAGEGADTGALENTADTIIKEAFTVPSTTPVVFSGDAYMRADVAEGVIGPLYLATLDVNEIKY